MMKLINANCILELPKIKTNSIDTVICDIPFGTSTCKWDVIIPFDFMWKQLNRITKSNSPIILFGIQPFTSKLIISNLQMFKYELIYKKRPVHHLLCNKRQMQGHENILVFYKKFRLYNPQMILRTDNELKRMGQMKCMNGTKIKTERKLNIIKTKRQSYKFKYPNSILDFKNDQLRNIKHSTQKNLLTMINLVKTYSNENDTILDFTAGSFTTGVACKMTNRNFIGIEINKKKFTEGVLRINKIK